MIIKENGTIITIADDSPIAQKITQGYDFKIKNGQIVIGQMGTDVKNKWQAIKSIQNATTLQELKTILIKFINIT